MDDTRAVNQAASLEQIAGDLDSISGTQLQNSLNQISSNWKGENSAVYVNKGRAVQSKITSTARELRKAADAIRRMAKNTYDSEMRAIQIAKDRTYH